MQVHVKIKRDVLLGAAKITVAEIEEHKSRVDEQIKALTQTMYERGARHGPAGELLALAENSTDDEIEISVREFESIAEHIPTR